MFTFVPLPSALVEWRKDLDRYFNLEKLVTEDLCSTFYEIPNKGVGISPLGSRIPTAHIQAQKFQVCPCVGLGGEQRVRCLQNQSMTEECYWVYRITGKVVPKDCDMEFNIYLDDKKIYRTDRKAEKGAPTFDLTGGGALVTSDRELDEYDTVCLKFEKGADCLWVMDGNKLCNEIYESGDEKITQKTELADFDFVKALGDEGREGPTTSSTGEGLDV